MLKKEVITMGKKKKGFCFQRANILWFYVVYVNPIVYAVFAVSAVLA